VIGLSRSPPLPPDDHPVSLPSLPTRRDVLAAAAGGFGVVVTRGTVARAAAFHAANARPRLAVVGCGARWDKRVMDPAGTYGVGKEFPKFADIVTVCDVDTERLGRAREIVKGWQGVAPAVTGDYRQVIDDAAVDAVHISTPDHWHAKIAIEAVLAGKDVYCEKPLTLTIDEGRQLDAAVRKTGRVVQVGTQQRSDPRFITAVALVQSGRLGKLTRVQCAVGEGPTSPPLPAVAPPAGLDWDRWLGPAPRAEHRYLRGAKNIPGAWARGHYEFRWWYDYSGGKLTDWGAHHVDIATWAAGKTETGPVKVEPVMVRHPVPLVDGRPTAADRYNTANEFLIRATYADGLELVIRHDTDNGILLEGSEGRIFVNRGKLSGRPVDDLATRPLEPEVIRAVWKGREPTDHVAEFFAAVVERREPIADVASHHRALTTCHLAGIAARLGRTIRWDPATEQIEGDALAASFLAREPRAGYETEG
jgi:predicted dehydrogenase